MTDSNEKPCHSSIKTPPPEPCTHPNPCPYSGEGNNNTNFNSLKCTFTYFVNI